MGKEEIARNEQFLLFPQCFLPFWTTSCYFHQILNFRLQTLSDWKNLNVVVWKRVTGLVFLITNLIYEPSNHKRNSTALTKSPLGENSDICKQCSKCSNHLNFGGCTFGMKTAIGYSSSVHITTSWLYCGLTPL